MSESLIQKSGRTLSKGYGYLVKGLAACAGIILVGVFVSIVYDVLVRTMGLQPPYWTSATTEYAMLFMCMFMAPLLTREKAHVYVEAILLMMNRQLQRIARKVVYVICILISGTFSGFATVMGYEAYVRNEIDYRSIDMPMWLLYAVIALGMAMTAIEFMRFLWGADDMYDLGLTKEGGI